MSIQTSGQTSAVTSWSITANGTAFAVKIALKPPSDVATARTEIQRLAYYIERYLYTSGKGPVTDAAVTFTVPNSSAIYASADVTAQTAKKIAWTSLTPEQAWNDYDTHIHP